MKHAHLPDTGRVFSVSLITTCYQTHAHPSHRPVSAVTGAISQRVEIHRPDFVTKVPLQPMFGAMFSPEHGMTHEGAAVEKNKVSSAEGGPRTPVTTKVKTETAEY